MLISTPPAVPATLADLRAYAAAAEAAGVDALMLDLAPGFEPLQALSALAPFTRTLKLCATATVDRGEPYTLARGFAALDHLTQGRALWRIGAIADVDRAREFVGVVRRLWQSWQADAVVFIKTTAVFADPAKIARIDHDGRHFHVRGPLNTPRPPQGCVPLLVDAGSPLVDLADVVIGQGATLVRTAAAGGER